MRSPAGNSNTLRWNRLPGHYEVYYLTLTDPCTGVGVWIRYTLLAPVARARQPPSAALWLAAMDPRRETRGTIARKATYPIEELRATADPFELRIGDARMSDTGMAGAFADVAWDLRWAPSPRPYEHVNPLLGRLGVASTVLTLPHADLAIDGTITLPSGRLSLTGARGAQAHLWGSKHASRWAWAHCNDFQDADGRRASGTFVDGVSAMVARLGGERGPATPVVGAIEGADFRSTSPLRVLTNTSTFALTGWRFEAVAGTVKLVGELDADRDQLVGVIYHDPDGEPAYCYNSETASMRLHVYRRARRVGGWEHTKMLVARRCAHFEYAQRDPVPDLELQIT